MFVTNLPIMLHNSQSHVFFASSLLYICPSTLNVHKIELITPKALLNINRIRDKIAQAYTHARRHISNTWSEMVSCSPYFAFYWFSSFHLFIQIISDNFLSLFKLALWPYSNLIVSHASFIIFLLTTSNLMLYLLQAHQFRGIYGKHLKEKLKDHNMWHVGLGNT